MKRILVVLLVLVALPSFAQKKAKSAPAPVPEPKLSFSLKEMGFGSQGTGIISCQYLTVYNNSLDTISIKEINCHMGKVFTVPSPAKSMYPVLMYPKRSMTISVCFTPDKPGDFKSKISFKMANDSASIPIWGKGIKPEDVSKLPKTEISVVPHKKGKEAIIKVHLATQSKVILQIMDDLGSVVKSYFNNEVVNPGNYEQIFDCTDKGGKKLPVGTFYARAIITDINTNKEIKTTKMFTVK
ncbi:MAG TPA: hypothetical protein VIX80_06390 [Candidatus Kapabacteria bacterium]